MFLDLHQWRLLRAGEYNHSIISPRALSRYHLIIHTHLCAVDKMIVWGTSNIDELSVDWTNVIMQHRKSPNRFLLFRNFPSTPYTFPNFPQEIFHWELYRLLVLLYQRNQNWRIFIQKSGWPHGHCKLCFEARKIKFVPQNPCNTQCCDYSEVVITESISEKSNLDYLNNLYSLKRKLPQLMRNHRSE